jgi:hypothetical protein
MPSSGMLHCVALVRATQCNIPEDGSSSEAEFTQSKNVPLYKTKLLYGM